MRYKIASLLAAAIAFGGVQVASAADMAVKAPPMAVPFVAYNWTGFFAGIQGGAAWGSVPNSFDVGGGPISQPAYKTHGGLIGAHAGYNWQMGSLVFGVIGDIEWANIKGDDGGLSGVTDQLKDNWRGSFRGRFGMAWDRVLVYATGGVAFATLQYSLIAVPPAVGSISADTTTAGWTVGGGAEYAFNPAWSAFVEYRYTDFGNHSSFFPATGFSAADTISYKYHDSAVRAGISYHFGK